MIEYLESHAAYWMCFLLLTVGLYGMVMKRNFLKKVIGLTIFQASIILFFIVLGYKEGGTVPVLDADIPVENADNYINPLPHTLMLTAIVVGVATVGVAFALLIRVYEGYDTLDEDDLREKTK